MQIVGNFQIRNCLVCDFVRREDSGKDILIGVYSGSIEVPKIPLQIPLSFYCQFQFLERKEGSLFLRLTDESGAVFFDDGGPVPLPASDILANTLVLEGVLVHVYRKMCLSLQASADKQSWTDILKVNVTIKKSQ